MFLSLSNFFRECSIYHKVPRKLISKWNQWELYRVFILIWQLCFTFLTEKLAMRLARVCYTRMTSKSYRWITWKLVLLHWTTQKASLPPVPGAYINCWTLKDLKLTSEILPQSYPAELSECTSSPMEDRTFKWLKIIIKTNYLELY